jgi:hypothetical protein
MTIHPREAKTNTCLNEEDFFAGTWGPKGSFFCLLQDQETSFLVWKMEPRVLLES